MNKSSLYNQDFYAWTKHTVSLLRQGKFKEVDVEYIAEEIQGIGDSEKRAFINRLSLVIAHLLRWQFQGHKRSNSWVYTLREQRLKLKYLLKKSPSLQRALSEMLELAYEIATLKAARQTGLDSSCFPEECIYSLEQCLDDHFYPE
jgi:Domain of unknown function DUF29